jgi:hypothetical protein
MGSSHPGPGGGKEGSADPDLYLELILATEALLAGLPTGGGVGGARDVARQRLARRLQAFHQGLPLPEDTV